MCYEFFIKIDKRVVPNKTCREGKKSKVNGNMLHDFSEQQNKKQLTCTLATQKISCFWQKFGFTINFVI